MKICGIDIERMKDVLFAVKVKTQLNAAFGLYCNTDYEKEKCETIDFCIALLNRITAESGNKTLCEIIYDIMKERNKSKFYTNKAKWIERENSFMCSNCYGHTVLATDYCPFCGKEMEIEQ